MKLPKKVIKYIDYVSNTQNNIQDRMESLERRIQKKEYLGEDVSRDMENLNAWKEEYDKLERQAAVVKKAYKIGVFNKRHPNYVPVNPERVLREA